MILDRNTCWQCNKKLRQIGEQDKEDVSYRFFECLSCHLVFVSRLYHLDGDTKSWSMPLVIGKKVSSWVEKKD